MDKLFIFAAGWWIGSRVATGQPLLPGGVSTPGGPICIDNCGPAPTGPGICPPGTLCMQAQAPAIHGLDGLVYANRGPRRYRRY